jgi:transcription initiation factor IIF auxiliary subunit
MFSKISYFHEEEIEILNYQNFNVDDGGMSIAINNNKNTDHIKENNINSSNVNYDNRNNRNTNEGNINSNKSKEESKLNRNNLFYI